MKTFEQYIEYYGEQEEKKFIELFHVNELDIRFNFIDYDVHLYYFYKDIYIFEYDKTFDRMCVNNNITNVIDRWKIKYIPTYTFIEEMMKKYLDLSYRGLFNDPKHICDSIQNDFKI